ncbi:MAG: hypothetical protein L3J76_00570 [Candidatus Hydrothermae bacterium]|nr:hypothetical protein [Candidatus Hydrothermae bacterium]
MLLFRGRRAEGISRYGIVRHSHAVDDTTLQPSWYRETDATSCKGLIIFPFPYSPAAVCAFWENGVDGGEVIPENETSRDDSDQRIIFQPEADDGAVDDGETVGPLPAEEAITTGGDVNFPVRTDFHESSAAKQGDFLMGDKVIDPQCVISAEQNRVSRREEGNTSAINGEEDMRERGVVEEDFAGGDIAGNPPSSPFGIFAEVSSPFNGWFLVDDPDAVGFNDPPSVFVLVNGGGIHEEHDVAGVEGSIGIPQEVGTFFPFGEHPQHACFVSHPFHTADIEGGSVRPFPFTRITETPGCRRHQSEEDDQKHSHHFASRR